MALTPSSIPAILASGVASHGGDIVLRKKEHGIWRATTWAELGARARDVGAALKSIGFRPGDAACVLAETRPEWAYIDLGILGAGGISGGLHADDDAERIGQALHESRCRVLFVENEEQLDKALLVRERCPALQQIVIIDLKGLRDFTDPQCESLQSFTTRGSGASDWDAGIAAITPEQPAVLLLHGGKARTLTHGDVLHLIERAGALLSLHAGDERLALLPMSHMMERVFGLYLALDARAISNYLESSDTIVENLQELQPTVLATDVHIWRLLHGRISTAAAGATRLQRTLYRWAIAAGGRGGAGALLARALVLRAVRRELGLARLRVAYVGRGGLASEIGSWATAIGIHIQQIDGQAAKGTALDARYQALMHEAYGT